MNAVTMNKKKIVIIIVVVIVLLAIAGGIYFIWQNSGPKVVDLSKPIDGFDYVCFPSDLSLTEDENFYFYENIRVENNRVLQSKVIERIVYKDKKTYNKNKDAYKSMKDVVFYNNEHTIDFVFMENDYTKDENGQEQIVNFDEFSDMLDSNGYNCSKD